MVYELKREPRLNIVDIIGAFLVYMGLLLFLVALHIIAINQTGNTAEVLSGAFSVFVTIYSFIVIFGIVAVIVQLLKWVTWSINMPAWKKREMRRGTR